jgi:H+-translocating NAD(P) transhydrogenase subunit alpha
MEQNLLVSCYIFVLAAFLGHHVIHRVPPLLHTPLMAGTNAIAGVSLVASLVPAGAAGGEWSMLTTILGTIAVFCASINAIGGFMITDRMLKMFRKKKAAPKAKGH